VAEENEMTNGDGELAIAEKAIQGQSVQARFSESAEDAQIYWFMFNLAQRAGAVPVWGKQPERDRVLRQLVRARGMDLLAGAMSSFVKKMNGLNWTIEGPERTAKRWQWILARQSEMGKGWLHLLPKGTQDYLSQDKGAFWEIVRATKMPGQPIVSIAHLDSVRCTATNDPDFPVIYLDKKNDKHILRDDQVIHILDMPSPGEDDQNLGMCAVSRVLASAVVIQEMLAFKEEKLSTRPVPGIAIAKGITDGQLAEALRKASEQDVKEHGRLLYRGFPIIAAMSADYEAGVDLVEFRSIPDGFNFVDETTFFIYTLALAFGVDAREFWPATVTGATKADALVQAQKARGKGPGEFINQIEFQLNMKVLPKGCTFRFDFQDDEEDRLQTEIRAMKVEMVRDLWEPSPVDLQGMITLEEARNLLVDMDILPEEFRIEDLTETEIVRDVEAEKRLWGKAGYGV